MLLINLCGGPGVGKSTAAAYLYYRLKKAGYRAELVGEAARELIYSHDPNSVAPPLLDNQLLMAGLQHERILRLQRHGVEVAINDSPLLQNALYRKDSPYWATLLDCMRIAERDIESYNVHIRRKFSYDPESRVQKTVKEARAHDRDVRELFETWTPGFWLEIDAGQEQKLANRVLRLLSA